MCLQYRRSQKILINLHSVNKSWNWKLDGPLFCHNRRVFHETDRIVEIFQKYLTNANLHLALCQCQLEIENLTVLLFLSLKEMAEMMPMRRLQRICYSHWANEAQNGVISIGQWGVFNHEKGIWQSHLAVQKAEVVTVIIFSNHKTS